MRRKDKEITDRKQINAILDNCDCCRIGFCDEGRVYIVPLNFGYSYEDETYTFYFHGAKEGRKIDLIKSSPMVGFELDTNYRVLENELACAFSLGYQSVIGTGRISFVDEMQEKKKALTLIMRHNSEKSDWEFTDSIANSVCIFKVQAEEISCKQSPVMD